MINGIVPENTGCKFCEERRRMQMQVIDRLEHGGREIVKVPLFEKQVKGIKMLRRYSQYLIE